MSSRLFIGNLSYNATEEDVRAAFTESGFSPKSVTVMTDRETGQARGFGFVELESPDQAKQAMQLMDGYTVTGRPIRVSEAHERERRDSGGSRPSGGGSVGHDQGRGGRGSQRRGREDDRW